MFNYHPYIKKIHLCSFLYTIYRKIETKLMLPVCVEDMDHASHSVHYDR